MFYRYFDPKQEGKVKVEDFKSGMRALNASIQTANGSGGPLSDDQLQVGPTRIILLPPYTVHALGPEKETNLILEAITGFSGIRG